MSGGPLFKGLSHQGRLILKVYNLESSLIAVFETSEFHFLKLTAASKFEARTVAMCATFKVQVVKVSISNNISILSVQYILKLRSFQPFKYLHFLTLKRLIILDTDTLKR